MGCLKQPFYKRRKKLIPPPRGASFGAKKIYVDAHIVIHRFKATLQASAIF